MTHNHIAWLLIKHQRDELTPGEEHELNEWLDAAPANRERFNLYTSPEWASQQLAVLDSIDVKSAKRKVLRQIRRQRRPKRTTVIGYASLFIIAVTASLFFWFKKDHKAAIQTTIVKKENAPAPEFKMDSGKVYLTIDENTPIEVQDAKDGIIAQKGTLQVIKEGKLYTYKDSQSLSSTAVKLFTSWGSQCQLQLPDGSRIWLNARSSLRYPAENSAFTRSVQLNGEAYFDITHDESRPFGVIVDSTEVVALGTKFNINAYPNEGRIKTFLKEGKIKIARGKEQKMLKPGEAASIRPGKPIEVFADNTIEGSIAWKDGVFDFDDASMSTIIRQLERWYNVKINYTDASHELYNGKIECSKPIDAVLEMIFTNKMRIVKKDGQITLIPVNN